MSRPARRLAVDSASSRLLPRGATVAAGCLVLTLASAAFGADPPYQKFYGEYVGVMVSEGARGQLETRDINAKIAPGDKDGFTVSWVLTIRKAGGAVDRDKTTIAFRPTKRDKVYSAGMRVDVFGNAAPLDPIQGDPYVWARIEGDTLTIHALTITENGGYELHRYDRTLIPGGLSLTYSRIRDGQVRRTITGKLKKVN